MQLQFAKRFKRKGRQLVVGLLRTGRVERFWSFSSPSVLLLSYPRSGSSWIGRVLACSPEVSYLREPVNQQYLSRAPGRATLVDLRDDPSARDEYYALTEEVCSGRIIDHPRVQYRLGDVLPPGRSHRHLLFKEVNPRAIDCFLSQSGLRVVLLLRNPAAVAFSFQERGWLGLPETMPDVPGGSKSLWWRFGYSYGRDLCYARERLTASTEKHLVVGYEEVALDPLGGFSKLFASLNLAPPCDLSKVVEEFSSSSDSGYSPYRIRRSSADAAFRWRKSMERQQVSEVLSGAKFAGFDDYWESSPPEESI